MKLSNNYNALIKVTDFLRNQMSNFQGLLIYHSTNQLRFYLSREFIEALWYGYRYRLFHTISSDEFSRRCENDVFRETKDFFSSFIFNFSSNHLATNLSQHRLTRLRNIFLELLLVDTYNWIERLLNLYFVTAFNQDIYLEVNILGNWPHQTDYFNVAIWNNQFDLEWC